MLDFDVNKNRFKVMKRVEVPRGEYTLDNAVNWVIRINRIYQPTWIFCDRGYGDYQVERLHIYGEDHPSSGLKNKVIGFQFKQNLEVIDPVTQEMHKEPMKQFMVNQLKLSFERDRIALCPFDETLHKQLVDYTVDRIGANGMPVYTSVNEHFVDALGLAHLAFVLKFKKLTGAIKEIQHTTRMESTHRDILNRDANAALRQITNPADPWKSRQPVKQIGKGPYERPGDYQKWVKVPLRAVQHRSSSNWGRRGGGFAGRSLW